MSENDPIKDALKEHLTLRLSINHECYMSYLQVDIRYKDEPITSDIIPLINLKD